LAQPLASLALLERTMRLSLPLLLACGGLLGGSVALADGRSEEAEAFFESRIRPVLAMTCFKCHGGQKTANDLRVDRREALLKGGESGPAIVPGHPEKSLLVRALRYTSDELKMPPEKKLPDAVIADFERWVREGAVWPKDVPLMSASERHEEHWAFRPVHKVDPPADSSGWSANPIDRFIHAGLVSHGLSLSPPADRRTLLRRAYFDLIGLPPTPAEVDAFLADKSPHAFADRVETLLASPHYGERWGRYWMDVVRYADTGGDNADYPIPEAHLYRDYIIDAFNADKPYDEFVREQIAGDLLAPSGPADKYAERVVATGFLALSRRYGTGPYDLWHLTLEDTIDTVGRAYLGITLRCARCHDHKFDPVPMRDYYALYGVFSSTQFPYAGSEEFQTMKFPRNAFVALLPKPAAAPLEKKYEDELKRVKTELARVEAAKRKKESSFQEYFQLQRRLRELERRGAPETLPVAYAVSEGKIADANIQLAGEPTRPGVKVPRGVPRFLAALQGAEPAPTQTGRLELADWLASPRNPLTARVMVNRVWQHHFGRGIVATPSNFGTRGSPPSHPELLDWLAASFVEHGWSIKWLHRTIMASKTYQFDSLGNDKGDAIDPANQWYWRFDRQRLDAEAIRDAMLAVDGTLDLNRPGAQPFPPITKWNWTQHYPFKSVYPSSHRSVYLMTQRQFRHPYLGLFDGPDTNMTTDVRSVSTVPIQALFLMNSDFMRETASNFAGRLCREASDPKARVRRAYELVYSRPALPQDVERACDYVKRFARKAAQAGLKPKEAEARAWTSYARTLLASNEFFYID
jgi:Protein of unknown function (DUF1553)/Protein of unknown function (DUF1549)/Planctomycete cytochrome C